MALCKKEYGNILITFLIGVLIGMGVMDLITRTSIRNYNTTVADTTYNKVKLDSITFVVDKHDTTIYKLNIKLKDDVEKSYLLSDSASINLFKQLTVQPDKDK